MTQTRTLLMIGCFVAALVAGHFLSPRRDASAQAPRGGPKWEYATLSYDDLSTDWGSVATWTTGKKNLGAMREKEQPQHPLSKLNKDLGGKEESASLGILLDRIGQDGWELVSHTHTQRTGGPRWITQTWTFKRPAQ
jgi:hypothetical protein